MQSVWLMSLLAIYFHTSDGFRFNLPEKCEKISVSFCRGVLPYNLTRFPNLLGHQNQAIANRTIQNYGPFVEQANCSKHAVFFVCSYLLPICLPGIDDQDVIKPCRSLCKQIRSDCPVMRMYWPSFVKCEELPEYADSVCIQPESFVAERKPTKIVNPNSCQDNRTPADYSLYASRRYDYVIKFKVILTERLENHEAIILGRVIRVFKHNNVTINKGRAKIWSQTNTTCSSLWTGRVFIIAGHEDVPTQKLLLSPTSLIEAWNEQTLKKIRRWLRLEKKMGKKKEVGNVSNM